MSATRRGTVGRLSSQAIPGAASQSASTGSAAGSAEGRAAATSARPATAAAGLAHIARAKVRGPRRAPRAVLAAAVSHSRRRRRVTMRTRVTPMACAISAASLARKASCRAARARALSISPPAPRRKTGHGCRRRGPASAVRSSGRTGKASAAATPAVHTAGFPGSTVQASARSAAVPGAARLRRRLSKIFQRAISGRRLRSSRPPRVATHGKSQSRICQSPRTQRWRRRAWVSTLAG